MTSKIDELYFGATRIRLERGTPLDFLQCGLYTGGNARGVMAAGLPADIRRAAGGDIERELRAQGPLLVGEAYLTSPGDLAGQGVKAIAHGIVARAPGEGSTLETSIAAILNGLRMLEEAGCRSVTIPQIGWRVANLDFGVAAAELARVLLTHLRRRSRLRDVVIVSRHADYLTGLRDALDTLIKSQPRADGDAAAR